MKRILYILAGAAAAGLLAYLGLGQGLHWYEMHRAQSEEDLAAMFAIALAVMAAVTVCGGWLGNRCYRRQSAKPDPAQ